MELGGGKGGDLDDERTVGPLHIIAADREGADAAAGRDDAAFVVGDIAGDGAVTGERAIGADGDRAGEGGSGVIGIADLQSAGIDGGEPGIAVGAVEDERAIA